MGGSKASRRFREFVGVALFATALIWIISLASYEPTDPVWFFSTGAHAHYIGRTMKMTATLPDGTVARVKLPAVSAMSLSLTSV